MPSEETRAVRLAVTGMSCDGCARAVRRAIQSRDPQADVSVDLAGGRVEVRSVLAPDTLARALKDAGYPARPT